MSITKADLVNLLNKKLGLPKKDCIQIVENFFSEISEDLAKGEESLYVHVGLGQIF